MNAKSAGSSKTAPPRMEDMSKEELKQTRIKQKQRDKHAQKVVESLIEISANETILLQCLQYINQCHYQDIVEERAIIGSCGYPLCKNKLPKMPSKQFYISTKQNKVYDITDRKNYCSNVCYAAGIYLKEQLLTSPLWFRDQEIIPKFKLLPTNAKGLPGQEVPQGIAKPENDTEVKEEKSHENAVPPKSNPINTSEPHTSKNYFAAHQPPKPKITPQQEKLNTDISVAPEIRIVPKRSIFQIDEEEPNDTTAESEAIEDEDAAQVSTSFESRRKPELLPEAETDSFLLIEKCLKDWISVETILFIHGEKALRQALEKNIFKEKIEPLLTKTELDVREKRYLNICKKLDLLELDDRRVDRSLIGEKLQPVPDYNTLKKQNEEMSLKVMAFYTGNLEIPEPEKAEEISDESGENVPAVLPLVDSQSQMALRRKIYMGALNRTMANILQVASIDPYLLKDPVKELVYTFTLSAKNTTFKTGQWMLISFTILKMLALRDENFKKDLDGNKVLQKQLKSLLKPLARKRSHLDRLILSKCDIYSFFNDQLECT